MSSPKSTRQEIKDPLNTGRWSDEQYPWRELSREQRWAVWLFLGVTVASPLLFGGVFEWALVTIALGHATACAAIGMTFRREHVSLRPLFLVAVFTALALWTAVQAMPLPCAWVATISPKSAEITQSVSQLASIQPMQCTLSQDPGNTRLQVLQMLAMACATLSGWQLTVAGFRQTARAAVACAALGVGLVSLFHTLAGMDLVWGQYAPVHARPALLGPLMNDNNLGGCMLLGAVPWLGWAAVERKVGKRLLFLVFFLVCTGVVVATRSLGAMGGLGFSLLLFGAWYARQRLRENQRLLPKVGFLALVLLCGSTVIASAYGFFAEEHGVHKASKAELLIRGAEFALDQSWAGVGRGAFSVAFSQVMGSDLRFEYAENTLIQWVAEWGWVLGSLGFLAVLYFLFRGRPRASVSGMAVWCGLSAFFLQNMVDFGIELAGIGVLVAIQMGTLGVSHPPKPKSALSGSFRRWACGSWVPLTLALGATTATLGRHATSQSVGAQQGALEAAYRSEDRPLFEERLREALSLHPSEASFYVLASAEAVRRKYKNAPQWLNRAMGLAPGWGAPHELAARMFLGQGRLMQAAIELKEAAQRHPRVARELGCGLLSEGHLKNVEGIVPDSRNPRLVYLELLSSCPKLPDEVASQIDALVLSTDPNNLQARLRMAERLLRSGQFESSMAKVSSQGKPEHDARAYILFARAQTAAGDTDGALSTLALAKDQFPQAIWPILSTRARTHAQLGDADAMRADIEALCGHAAGSAKRLADAVMLMGQLEAQLGNRSRAIQAFRDAFQFDGRDAALRSLAHVAESAGNYRMAYHTYLKLLNLVPSDPTILRAKERLETKMRKPTGNDMFEATTVGSNNGQQRGETP